MPVKMKAKKADNILLGAAGAILLFLMVRRLHYTVSHYDEVFNIYVSYMTVGMGKRHLVENQMMMSMGNLFNLPFIYAFYHLTDGMEGIVLFIRYMYLAMNLVLGGAFYASFHEWIGKKNSILFSLILISYAPFSIYSIWYDSAALFFLLAGAVLLMGARGGKTKKAVWLKYLAGICHACMVYAYPTMAGVIIVIFIAETVLQIKEKRKIKEIAFYWMPYVVGGITVVLVLAAYILHIGWENIFLFQDRSVKESLSGRTLGNISADVAESAGESPVLVLIKSIFDKLYSIALSVWHQQKKALGTTILLLIQWAAGLRRKGILRILLIPEIILVAAWSHNGMGQWATQTMYAYYFFWAPFLYFYLEKEDRKRWNRILPILGGAAIAGMIAVGFTAYYDMKASMGLYSGAIATFLLMILVVKDVKLREMSSAALVIILLAGCNIFMLYQNVYEDGQISRCTHLMQKGIYRGIIAEEKDAVYEKLPDLFDGIDLKEDATLYTNDFVYMPAYIEGGLLPNGGDPYEAEIRLLAGEDAEIVYREGWWTDVIIMDNKKYEECPKVEEYIFERYFDLIYEQDDFYMYVRKESRV